MGGLKSCDRSVLSQTDAVNVAASDHRRNVGDCRRGSESCDLLQTAAEAGALSVARYQQNLSDCMEGWEPCDGSSSMALTRRRSARIRANNQRIKTSLFELETSWVQGTITGEQYAARKNVIITTWRQ